MRNKKIYILHGWAYSTEKWEPFVAELKQSGIEPVLLKIPGLTAPLNEVWNLDNYVEWLKKIVEKDKEVTLLGHSNGGRISLAFAHKYPEIVKQLFLIDSAGIYHNEFSIRIKRFVFKNIAKIGRKLNQSQSLRPFLYRLARETDYQKANPILRKTMTNLINSDLIPVLSSIAVPTAIIWGEQDKVTPIKDGILMNSLIKNSSFHIISAARHSPQFNYPEKVAEIIIKELQ